MKFLTIAALSLFAFGAFAEDSLSDMKSDANEMIAQKMSTLNTSKACIDGAKTKEAFKACKFDMHESMKAQKEEAEDKTEKSIDSMED
jgi:glutamine synthetase type III